jgi:hypothetical protein
MSTHSQAVDKAIAAGTGTLTDAHAPLLELCRTLARQMDATDDPSTRLTAAYLSALKDLGRLLATSTQKRGAGGALARLQAQAGDRRAAS